MLVHRSPTAPPAEVRAALRGILNSGFRSEPFFATKNELTRALLRHAQRAPDSQHAVEQVVEYARAAGIKSTRALVESVVGDHFDDARTRPRRDAKAQSRGAMGLIRSAQVDRKA